MDSSPEQGNPHADTYARKDRFLRHRADYIEIRAGCDLLVAFGLVLALAAWAYLLISTTVIVAFFAAGGPASETAVKNLTLPALNDALKNELIYLHGIYALNQGYLLTSMIFSATLVYVIDRQFLKACGWMAAAAVLAMIGLIHAYDLMATGVQNKFGFWASPQFAIAYWATTLLLLLLHLTGYSEPSAEGQVS